MKKRFIVIPIIMVMLLLSQTVFADVPLTTQDLDTFSWRNIGPYPFSGRITTVAVPKGQSTTYYVATGTGGVWTTVDSGISFKPIFEKYGNMSIGFIAIAPSNADIIYLGTGESLHARASYRGNGMWKSTDAGKTWTHIGLKDSYYIPKIEVDHKNPDILYAAAEGKLYDNKMDCQRGLYKSTDGGKTWKRVLDLKDRGVVDFVIDPNNSDMVIAAAYKTYRRTWTFIDRQKDNHLYKTTDGGKNWKKLTNGLPMEAETGRNGISIYDKNPRIVYVRIDEEVTVGLSEEPGRARYREGRLFKDGFYFNTFKNYRINPQLLKKTGFKPLEAKDEKELAKKLNECIKDKKFVETNKIDMPQFLQTAERLYGKDKDITESIREIKKTLKRDEEKKDCYKKVNRLFLYALLAHNKNIEFKDTIRIKDPVKAEIHPCLIDQLTFEFKPEKKKKKDGKDQKGKAKTEGKDKKAECKDKKGKKEEEKKLILDEQTLLAGINEWASEPDLITRLGVDPDKFAKAIKKAYKKDEAILAKLAGIEETLTVLVETSARHQTINRFVLQTLYANCLKIMEPVKKAGFIFRSDDQGETWKRMTEYQLAGGSDVVNQVEAGYNGRLMVDPNDDKVIYAHETLSVWSTDSGKTFKFTKWYEDDKVHVDSRYIWVDPENSLHLLNANDGGLSETWDGGKNWSQKETIDAQQFYDISVDNEMPYNVMGGTQDNGSWIGPSQNRNRYGVYPADWTYLPSGDGFYVVRNRWNPEYIYFESQFGYSRRMNFKTGEMISLSRRNTAEERAQGNPPQRYQWNSPIFLSPHNPGIVFVCSQHVHRSQTRGDKDTFITISPDLSKNIKKRIEESKKTNLQYGTVFTFAESPVKPGIYWAGTDDGNLQLSTNYGTTWTNITNRYYNARGKARGGIKGDRIPYDRWVMRVAPSKHDEKTCYVAYSGYRTHNEDTTYLYVTHDMGKTWKNISGGLNAQANDIEEDPHNKDILYLATDYGLYVTFDQGKKWTEMSETTPDVIIKDLSIQERDRDLVIASYGVGIFIADIYPFKEFKTDTFKKDNYLFDIQKGVKWNRLERRGQSYGVFAKVKNPPIGGNIYYYLSKPANSVKLVIKDLEGKIINELSGKKKAGIQKIFWNFTKRKAAARRSRRGDAATVSHGVYKVTLIVNGKEAGTKKLTIIPDPKF